MSLQSSYQKSLNFFKLNI